MSQGREKVAVVTGANKGVGFALVKRLLQLPFPGVVYLTARDEARGKEAVQQLKAQGLNPNFHLLDISSSQSIERFADFLKRTHGGVDVVIANGGAPFPRDMTPEMVSETLKTNNKGNAEFCLALLPLLKPDARLLIVASGFGQVVHLGPDLQKRFLATDTMSVNDLNNLIDEYVSAVKDGTFAQKGWPDWSNKVNKIGLVALARILARQLQNDASKPGILVNAVCPGWTVTDTSKPYLDKDNKFGDIQAKQPNEAAVDVIWLATLPPGTKEPQGQLVQYRKIIPYEG